LITICGGLTSMIMIIKLGEVSFVAIAVYSHQRLLTTPVDTSTIRNWERNRGGVETFMRLAKLCEALNCQPQDLFKSDNLNVR
jgi:transcriptional regulator with XRE-family HTH domain